MAVTSERRLVARFAALGDDTRWSVLTRVGRSPASASALAAELPVSRQAIARHLEVLRAAGLVEVRRHGREAVYQAVGAELSAVADDLVAVARGWEHQLAAVKRLAESRTAQQPPG